MRVWLLLMKCITCHSERDLVSALNARFRAGTPSDDPASAGVVVHAIDNRDQQFIKGLGPGGLIWRPNTQMGQMVSCSLMNAQLQFIYTRLSPLGVVLSSLATVCRHAHSDYGHCVHVRRRVRPSASRVSCG